MQLNSKVPVRIFPKLKTTKYKICISQQEGIEFIKKNPNNRWFVKASGLAEGKGANLDHPPGGLASHLFSFALFEQFRKI